MDVDYRDAPSILQGLIGQEIHTITGRPNWVLSMAGEDVVVGTTKSPSGQRVPVAWVQEALDRLWLDGELEISVPSVGYRSAFIGAVLSTIPGAVATSSPQFIRMRISR
jgi:hypothetical protein